MKHQASLNQYSTALPVDHRLRTWLCNLYKFGDILQMCYCYLQGVDMLGISQAEAEW